MARTIINLPLRNSVDESYNTAVNILQANGFKEVSYNGETVPLPQQRQKMCNPYRQGQIPLHQSHRLEIVCFCLLFGEFAEF